MKGTPAGPPGGRRNGLKGGLVVSEDTLQLSDIEKEIGVPVGFFADLRREDSWSFVIKLHAFFEGLLSNLLVLTLDREELRDVFSHIPLSDAKFGKLVFAQKLNLLEKSSITFIRKLSELRNDLVHNPRNVTFDMKDYVHRMDLNQRKAFRESFGVDFSDMENDQRDLDRLLNGNPQAILYLGALKIVYDLSAKRWDAKIASLRREYGQVLLSLERERS